MAKWREPDQGSRQCPLGDDCDLTTAWMLGRQNAKDEIAALKEQLEAARRDAKEAEAYAEELERALARKHTPNPWKDV